MSSFTFAILPFFLPSCRCSGDFIGHRNRVIALASEGIPGANTDVVASCDGQGCVLVWTVSRIAAAPQQQGGQQQQAALGPNYTFIISRRPQRMFRANPCVNASVDLSWQLGVVAVTSHSAVSVYSIERDELLRTIDVSSVFATSSAVQSATATAATAPTGDLLDLLDMSTAATSTTTAAATGAVTAARSKVLGVSSTGSAVCKDL